MYLLHSLHYSGMWIIFIYLFYYIVQRFKGNHSSLNDKTPSDPHLEENPLIIRLVFILNRFALFQFKVVALGR